jgi:hypothetical protein
VPVPTILTTWTPKNSTSSKRIPTDQPETSTFISRRLARILPEFVMIERGLSNYPCGRIREPIRYSGGESGPSQLGPKSVFVVSLQDGSHEARNNNVAGQCAKEDHPFLSHIQKPDPNTAGSSFSGAGEQAPRFRKILPAIKDVRQHASSGGGTESGCPHPMTLIQRGNTDPFSASPMKITSWNHSLIEIWKTTFTQSMVPSALQTSSTSLEVWSNEGKEMTQCLDGLSLILTWTSMLRSFAMPKSPLKDRIQVDALAYSCWSRNATKRALFNVEVRRNSSDVPCSRSRMVQWRHSSCNGPLKCNHRDDSICWWTK